LEYTQTESTKSLPYTDKKNAIRVKKYTTPKKASKAPKKSSSLTKRQLDEQRSNGGVVLLMVEYSKSKPIQLNVGGKNFVTTIETLIKEKSVLEEMFTGKKKIVFDDHGSVFIDRDPDLFGLILEYLRTGRISSGGTKKFYLSLKREAIFFSLESLVLLLEERIVNLQTVNF